MGWSCEFFDSFREKNEEERFNFELRADLFLLKKVFREIIHGRFIHHRVTESTEFFKTEDRRRGTEDGRRDVL